MIDIDIPGFRRLQLGHLVMDYNGTLAVDGQLLPGVADRFTRLACCLELHVITADTFGVAADQLAGLPATLTVTPLDSQAEAKLQFVSRLGVDSVIAIGNGRNDRLMIGAVALGIAVLQREGAAAEAIAAAAVVSTNIVEALDLLLNPKRLIATLRS
jgi:soluble P-type ATPase